jgi:hypothetical protein
MKTTNLFLFAAAIAAGLLAGCSTVASRIGADPEGFARLPPDQQTLVRQGRVGIGFNEEAVRLALGEPTRITTRTTKSGRSEVWHYGTTEYYNYGPVWGMAPGWGYPGYIWPPGWADGPYRNFGDWYGDPYYWAYPGEVGGRGRDRIRVEFKGGLVVAIDEEHPRY